MPNSYPARPVACKAFLRKTRAQMHALGLASTASPGTTCYKPPSLQFEQTEPLRVDFANSAATLTGDFGAGACSNVGELARFVT